MVWPFKKRTSRPDKPKNPGSLRRIANENPPPDPSRVPSPPPPPPPPRGGIIGQGRDSGPEDDVKISKANLKRLEALIDRIDANTLPLLRYSMPTPMSEALGYDSLGNNPTLVSEADRTTIEAGLYVRLSPDQTCPVCQQHMRSHPAVQGALWLTRACQGLVKL